MNIHTLYFILYRWYEKNNTSGSNNTLKSKVDLLGGKLRIHSLRLVLLVNLRNVSVISNVHDILTLLELWITITLNWATELNQKRRGELKKQERGGGVVVLAALENLLLKKHWSSKYYQGFLLLYVYAECVDI